MSDLNSTVVIVEGCDSGVPNTLFPNGTLPSSRWDFVARLAALVPTTRCHLVLSSGVLAPATRFRAQIVPEGPDPTPPVASHPG